MGATVNRSPFKFLDSYTATDRDIFFGRDAEVEEVYSKVFQSNLLLVYGASGTGKSSIINCGLANKLNDSDWLPVHVRRGENMVRSMYRQVSRRAITPVAEPGEINEAALKSIVNSVFLDHFKPVYFIFDQFEELFIFGYRDEWLHFIQAVRELMDSDLDVHFIFVIRGEYLEFLSEFEDAVPEFFDNRMRVERMTRKNAIESILGPASLFSIKIEDGFEEKLLRKLSPDKAQVELTFLQVFLDRIYRDALESCDEDDALVFTNDQLENLGPIDDVLAEFLDEQLFRMEDSRSALTVLKAFVSLQGTRKQMTEEQVFAHIRDLGSDLSVEQVRELVGQFVNKRILKDKDDNGQYELRHDSLALRIFEKISHQERELLDVRQFISYSFNEYQKRGILLNDNDLVYIAPYERQLKLDQEVREFIALSKKRSAGRKRSRRTLLILGVIIVGFTITSVAGFIYSQRQKAEIEKLASLAQSESQEASRQQIIAEQQRTIAQQNEQEASEQARLALEAREEALRLAAIAETQRKIAEDQMKRAEQERAQAEIARNQAEQNAREALRQKAIADQQTQIAERLQMLSIARELALKSMNVNDPELSALLARQAWTYNNRYDGYSYQPEIWQSLHKAVNVQENGVNNTIKIHSNAITDMVRAGNYIITTGHDSKINKVGKDQFLQELTIEGPANYFESLASLVDDQFIAAGTRDGYIQILHAQDGKTLFKEKIMTQPVQFLLSDENGNNFIAGSKQGQILSLNVDGKVESRLDIGNVIVDMDFSDGTQKLLVATQSGEILVFNNMLQEVDRLLLPSASGPGKISVNSEGHLLIAGYSDGTLVLFDIESKQILQEIKGHAAAITALDFDPSGVFFASGGYDRVARIWNLQDMQERPIEVTDFNNWISTLKFTAIKNQLMVGTYDGTLKLVDTKMENMAVELCRQINRSLTEEEWNEYIGEQIDYETSCEDE